MVRVKGTGTIIEKRRGVFEVQLSCGGKDPTTGRYRRISRTIHGTKRDAARALDELRAELDGGLKADAASITFAEWCDEWLTIRRAKGTTSESVLLQYKTRLEFMSSLLGKIKLNKIDARTVEQLLIAIKEKRSEQGIPCSDSTLRHYYGLLKQTLKTAVDYDLLLRNPCDRVTPPKKNPTTRTSLSVEEGNSLLKAINNYEHDSIANLLDKEKRQEERDGLQDRSYLLGLRDVSLVLMVRLGLASGCRLGECLALTWGAVDFSNSRIAIVQAMDNLDKLKAPKSAAGVRSLFIDGETMTHLKAWKALQGSLLETLGIEIKDSSPVFCSAEGGFIAKASFRHWWDSWKKWAGFPKLRFHELRHTQASQLLANGMDIKSVQKRMGHSSASLTLDVYAHALDTNDEKAALLIGNLFSDGKPQAALVLAETV